MYSHPTHIYIQIQTLSRVKRMKDVHAINSAIAFKKFPEYVRARVCVWSICLHVWQLLAHKCREQRQRRFGIIFILTRKFVSKNITHHLIYTHTMCKAIKARIKMYVATHFESLYQRHTKGYSKDSTYTELNCNDTNTHTHTRQRRWGERMREIVRVWERHQTNGYIEST